MFAIVELNGQQYKVDDAMKTLRVQYLADKEVGASVNFDKVLLSEAKGSVALGGKANISATVASHDRDETVIVFKKKRRKGYRKMNGHRQNYTLLNVSIA
jgi:large subunit ribosomal protein L21